MAISPVSGTGTTTVKVNDLNAVITVINAELTALAARIGADDDDVAALNDRLSALEQTPLADHGHAALTDRVAALEALVQRAPAQVPAATVATETPPRPAGLDTSEVRLVYNQAVLYYGDVELHAQRIDGRRWRLQSRLNYIVISPAEWTYEEIVEGTPEEVYEWATRRLIELAELKPQHDAVHDRVRRMSEGVE